MNPKIKTKEAFHVIGLEYVGKNEHQEIGLMWDRFNQTISTIPNMIQPIEACYGICFMIPGDPEGSFHYIAGVPVRSLENIPEGFVGKSIPKGKYAVFTHYGKLDTLQNTYQHLYQEWLPKSGLKMRGDLDFEYYDDRFLVDSDQSEFDIYVALKE